MGYLIYRFRRKKKGVQGTEKGDEKRNPFLLMVKVFKAVRDNRRFPDHDLWWCFSLSGLDFIMPCDAGAEAKESSSDDLMGKGPLPLLFDSISVEADAARDQYRRLRCHHDCSGHCHCDECAAEAKEGQGSEPNGCAS